MLNHADIWRAIDRLAERHGFSPSGLARKAGLSPTIFNPSKRINGKRKRWPSTESIAAILRATGSSLDEFVALSSDAATQHTKLPVMGLTSAAEPSAFDEAGLPAGLGWDDMPLPAATDAQAFALEITGRALEPAYREGDRVILSPAEKPRRGDRVALRMATGEILIKILGQEGAQKIELLPLNAEEQPLTLARKDIGWMFRIVWASQ
jgi:phage repressor protein C with HTH and peptisase S24 domain